MADQEGVTTASYVPNPQELPEYLSYSTYVTTIGNTVYTTQTIIQLPQIYYGPSIPLGEGWTFGGSVSPTTDPYPGTTAISLPVEPSGTDDGITTTGGNTPSPIIPIPITVAPTSASTVIPSTALSPSTTPSSPSSSSSSTPTSTSTSPPPSSTTSSASSPPNKGLSTPALILATILPITAFFLLVVGVLLWRNRRDRTRERGQGYRGVHGGGGGSRGVYGALVGRNGQNRRGLDLGTNAGSNASAGMAGAGGGGSGGGSGGRAVLAGGVGGSRSAGSGRGDDDDEDVGDIGNGAVLESGNGSGRRWLPTLLAATGLRQRSASARLKHQNRVASTNVWGDGSDDDDDFEMIDLPGRVPYASVGGIVSSSTRSEQPRAEDEIDDEERTPRASLADADLASVRTGRRGMDDSRGDLGLEELAPFMGDVTPTNTKSKSGEAGKGRARFMAVLGFGAGRSRSDRDNEGGQLGTENVEPDGAEAGMLSMATLGREPKISQTDSSTPSSRQGFFPVGTAAKKQFRRDQAPSGSLGGNEKAPGKKGHVKSDSFPSVAGGNDLFYSYPAESSKNARALDTGRNRTDSGVAKEGPGGEEMLRSSSGSRFSISYSEEYSSGSAGSRNIGQNQGQSQQFVSEQDLAALGMPLPIPVGRFDGEGDGARTPNSYRSAQSQLRFPVPPDRSREPSVLGQVGVVSAMEGVTRSVSADTSETRYHSLNDQVNTLTRRSRSSATTANDEEDQTGVDEHGRRTGPAAIDGSYGTSSAIRNTSLAQTPVRTGMVESEEHDLETTPLAGTSDRQPRPRLPLSALPSPTSTETPSSWTQPNRFSVIAGSISSLFGAKRASVVSSVTEGDHDHQHQQAYPRRPTSGYQRNNSSGEANRQSYAGQPLVPEEVYREAFLSGIPEAARREARQESSGDTRDTFGSVGMGSDETGRRELGEGVTSEGDGSGETFGVKSGRDRLGAGVIGGPGLGERARVVTPSNRGNEAARATRGTDDGNPESTTRRIGEFGEVISGPAAPGREVLRLPGEMRKTSTLFIPGSPYSPAQASSQSASVQDEGSKSSANTSKVSSLSNVGTVRTRDTGRSERSEGSEISDQSLGVVSGLAPGGIGEAGGIGRIDYSGAAVRGKRSMPQLVNTPDALAGNIPRTDTPPPATASTLATVPGPAMAPAPRSTATAVATGSGGVHPILTSSHMPSTPPPRSRSTSSQVQERNVVPDNHNRDTEGSSAEADEPLLPPQPPFVTATRETDTSASPSRSSNSANSEKRREKEKWWLGRFGKDQDKE